jgi:putative hydrolase of HD superfamily
MKNRDVEFLFEIGMLRFMPRQWSRFLSPNLANNTEHLYRVTWIALVIAEREGVKTTDKIMKMALAHDIAESRTGDVDYISRQYTDHHETEGQEDMLAQTSLEKEFLTLLNEYKERKTIEAKIVKDADNLDVDMELREQTAMGNTLEKEKRPMRNAAVRDKLFTDTARELYDKILTANPHDWWRESPRNRANGGDWKKK